MECSTSAMPAELAGGAAPAPATLPSLPSSDAVDQAERDPASVRSLAVAKLRRAASLPRQKDGRRPASPAVVTLETPSPAQHEARSSSAATASTSRDHLPDEIGSFRGRIDWSADYDETQSGHGRQLPPAATMFPSLGRPVQRLQRSASVSAQHPADGRVNPLPTLQAIQSRHLLQRSNSRTEAMARLTGERLSRSKPPSPTPEADAFAPVASAIAADFASPPPLPDLPPALPRPRLGRSFTISTGASGERRSVVGRRMMARLGNRAAAAAADDSSPEPSGHPPPLGADFGSPDLVAADEPAGPSRGAGEEEAQEEEVLASPPLSHGLPVEHNTPTSHEETGDVVDLSKDVGSPMRPLLFTVPATPSRGGGSDGGARESLDSPFERSTHHALSVNGADFEDGGS